MRVLITGITGMVGSHLAEYCLARGDVEVVGTVRWRSPRDNIAGVVDRARLVETDLRDQAGVRRLLEDVQPDAIFHLAAQSFVPASWTGPADTMMTNVLGQVHLLEAMRDLEMTDVPMQIAGSSEEYGLVHPEETPITGLGVETVGTDAGQAMGLEPAFPCHELLLGAGKHGLTQLQNLERLPVTGSLLIVSPLPIVGGSGSPARVYALVERDQA
jgi:hypothetical protein